MKVMNNLYLMYIKMLVNIKINLVKIILKLLNKHSIVL